MQRRLFLNTFGVAALHSAASMRLAAAAKAVAHRDAEDVAADEDFWREVCHSFTIDRNVINLNNGSVSPAPRVVQDAMKRYWDIINMHPSHYVDDLLLPHVEGVRLALASAFGCDGEELAIMRNTSEAMESVILGLDLKRGDEVLTTTQDYPSLLTALRQRERRDGIIVRKVPFPVPPKSLEDLTARIENGITPKTRAILICHVTYTTGQIFPVKAISQMARKRGIYSLVDGAHAFAQFPFRRDDLDCDFYATSLHKWLTAPVGTGFLYVRRDLIKNVWPLMAAPDEMDSNIRKFEQQGTYPVAMKNAITEAMTFHLGLGADRKAARLRYLRRRWSERLAANPRVRILNSDDPRQSCGLGAFNYEGMDAQKLTDLLLKQYRIHVRPRFVPGEFSCIRVTPNVYTTLGEIDRFGDVMETILKNPV